MSKRKKYKKSKKGNSFIGRIILIINALAILALLITYTAPYINPNTLIIPSFFGLAYPYIAAINFVFIIFWILANKIHFLWSFIAILAGWYHLSNHIQINSRKDPGTTPYDLKIMTYNVRAFDFYDWKKDEGSLKAILGSIEQAAPDVVCIQEFYNNRKKRDNMKQKVEAIHGLKYSYANYFYTRHGEHEFGIATFSSLKIIESKGLSIDGSDRSFGIYTDIVKGNDTMRVYNLHLASSHFGNEDYSFVSELGQGGKSNTELKEGSVKILRKLAGAYQHRAIEAKALSNHLQHCPYKAVICGDFNDTPVSFAYKTIAKDMKDAFRTAGRGLGKTYAGILPSFRIDYILYSGEMEVFNYKVIKNDNSDHYPVTTYLNFHPAGEPQ